MICKLAFIHGSIFSKQQTVGKMPFHELLSLDNSGSGWDNVLLIQKFNKRGGLNMNVLVCFFDKVNGLGDVYSGLESGNFN